MEKLAALFENEQILSLISENEEVITEASNELQAFVPVMKEFIMANPMEFIAENVEETKKNLRVFVEAATSQYMTELTEMLYANIGETAEVVQESDEISKYL